MEFRAQPFFQVKRALNAKIGLLGAIVHVYDDCREVME